MATVRRCSEQLDAMHQRVAAQIEALEPLAEAFGQEAERMARHAQVLRLGRLREEIEREVASQVRSESAASIGFSQGKLLVGGISFGLGSLAAALRGSQEHPLLAGARWAAETLEGKAPFGRVMVAIGSGGVPDGAKVVCISRLARESGKSEAQIESSLQREEYMLFLPEEFAAMMEELQRRVRDGAIALPVAANQLPS